MSPLIGLISILVFSYIEILKDTDWNTNVSDESFYNFK